MTDEVATANHDRYKVRISTPGIPDVVVLHDESPAQISAGYGGWTVTSRERRVGLTQWDGKDPIRMLIPVLFDGVSDSTGQELQISALSRMALPPKKGGEPPVVTIDGHGLPNPGPQKWVIESLTWGTNVLWDFNRSGVMARVRQDCVINLLEYSADDRVTFRSLKPGVMPGWPKTYVVKSHDTLKGIAVRMYGDISKWKDIASANNIRDPKNLKKGRKLTLPSP